MNFIIGDKPLSLEKIWEWLEKPVPVSIHSSVKARMAASRKVVDDCLKDGKPHYGINTGFGNLARVRVPDDKLIELQSNFLKSHSTGVGEPFPDNVVRLMMLLRANVLAMGYTGVRYSTLEYLVHYMNKGKIPHVPSQGSVGASGDLAPLSHIGLALIDDGLKLAPKEGLSFANGTQASLSVAVVALKRLDKLMDQALKAAALSLEGLRGAITPFDERIAVARPHDGHAFVAKFIREMTIGSQIISSHKECKRVQDPYSLRCIPQVLGTVVDSYNFARGLLERELSCCTDNPLIFDNDVLSAGNFHGMSVAVACDSLSIATTILGGISERRIEQMVNPKQDELPVRGLIKDSGLNTGFFNLHVTSSAIASENKTLAHPASVDSIPTFAGQEDYVSMAMWAARKFSQVVENVEKIIAIELLSAAQAIDMQDERLEPGKGTKKVHEAIRKKVSILKTDRALYKDVETMLTLMKQGLV